MTRPAAYRIPLSAFVDVPASSRSGVGLGLTCSCGAPCWGHRCNRCAKRDTRAAFLAKWEVRYPREEILGAMLEALGWVGRNYDFSEEREAFLAALEANAEPEEFRRILAEGGLDDIIEERDQKDREWRTAWMRSRKERAWADQTPVPALVLTQAEARVHASELLRRPRFWQGLNSRSHWSYQDDIYLQVLCIAGTPIDRAAEVLGRQPTAVAWRASDGGLTIPSDWRALLNASRPQRAPSPRWVPMAYPFVPASRRAENAELMEVNSLVAEYLPGRADICQEIMLALLEKRTTLEELRKQGAGLRSFIRQFYRSNHEFGGYARSLDAPLTPNGDFSLLDTLH